MCLTTIAENATVNGNRINVEQKDKFEVEREKQETTAAESL